jgi:carbohydrate-selective porin OprB
MAVRDFDPTQINSDFSAILEQAGIAFTYQGVSVTGIWSASRDAFADFEEQRRDESRFTVFLQTSSVSAAPRVTQTLSRAGVTYFIDRVTLDAEGTGCEIEVSKSI